MSSLKYYVYVSDSKLDMLYAQIPTPLRKKIAGELRIDLKVVGLSLRQNPSEETRFSKVAFVSEYLRKHEEVGTADRPGRYFEGVLPMKWGPLDLSVLGGEQGQAGHLAFFGGSTVRTIVGLTGSMRHVLGQTGVPAAVYGDSLMYGLLPLLRQAIEDDSSIDAPLESNETSLHSVAWAVDRVPGPEQPMEFLAKKLLFGSPENVNGDVLLGTPVYVALAA